MGDVNTNGAVRSGADLFGAVIGQAKAVEVLRAWTAEPVHAYLFTGPSGTGKEQAAFAFAAAILASGADDDDADRITRRVVEGIHPDVEFLSPEANQLGAEDVRKLTPSIFKKPVEGRRRIVIVDRFDSATPAAAASLLKPVEEPPPGTVLILLREAVLPEHVAIASRCVEVLFSTLSDEVMGEWLRQEGVEPELAATIIEAAAGDRSRAELLLSDTGFAERAEVWRQVPERLDGSGNRAAALADELRTQLDAAVAAIEAAQAVELEALSEREEQFGTRGSGRAEMEARHKREIRKVRTDEIRFGFAVLARRYREALVGEADVDGGASAALVAVSRLRDANEALIRNPSEGLMLQNLLWQLPTLRSSVPVQV